MSVIDFRLRPPVGGYLGMLMFSNAERRDRATRMHGFEPARSASAKSIDLLIEEMDAAGVDMGVMVGRSSATLGSVSNDDLLAIQKDYPGRFIGIASIRCDDRKAAQKEMERAAEAGFRAIGIEPTQNAVPMAIDDRRIYPIYAKLEELGLPVVIMAGGSAGPDLSATDPVHIDRVAGDFPDMKIVVTHGGWPWVHQILHVAYRRANLYLSPDQYMANMPGMDDYAKAADGFLSDRFLYGSSYPFTPVDAYASWFRSLPIRPQNMEKVMFTNAARLLGLSAA